ncbi:MAG: peptidoglycan DD-metalloendopeptidase family protein [Coriobacteriales bacterium]|jgi:murein DD-endopeptidase MepM/ murein hydrolase activator NlpD|nr:peptidoglycan DD-metalloendopeptidase family protein [Coriobacteriales bacterium]
MLLAIALGALLTLSSLLSPHAPAVRVAYAATSAEKQAEADEMMRRLDDLQTELNQINIDYDNAIAVHAEAERNRDAAQMREESAHKRIGELQGQLGARAQQMYRNGSTSFLDVILGAQSFEDFAAAIDMVNRINARDADLIAESKVVRAEAEAAKLEYARQSRVAAEKEAEIATLKAQKESTAAEMSARIDELKAQAAELLVQEELAAEEARRRAEEDARRGGVPVPEEYYGLVPPLVHPCPGYSVISSHFGPRGGAYHLGTDFAAPTGTPIYAAAGGTVISSGSHATMGLYVTINHGNSVRTTYMHASALYVSAGETVAQGQVIAAVGSTGDSTGPHLHFQLNIGSAAYNPLVFL